MLKEVNKEDLPVTVKDLKYGAKKIIGDNDCDQVMEILTTMKREKVLATGKRDKQVQQEKTQIDPEERAKREKLEAKKERMKAIQAAKKALEPKSNIKSKRKSLQPV